MSEVTKAQQTISEQVTLIGQPQIKSGIIKSGPRVGQSYHYVKMMAYKSNYVTNEAGQTVKTAPTYYNLSIFGAEDKTKQLAQTLQPQMKAQISGHAREYSYADRNGEQKTAFNVNVKNLSLELKKTQQIQAVQNQGPAYTAERPQLAAERPQTAIKPPMPEPGIPTPAQSIQKAQARLQQSQPTNKGFER